MYEAVFCTTQRMEWPFCLTDSIDYNIFINISLTLIIGPRVVQSICYLIDTHYHNSNLIWRTVSRQVDEVIPSDHPNFIYQC